MTTIAYKAGIMASDSRCTGDYVSTAQKLYRGPRCLIGLAGDLGAALVFMDWYLDRKKPMPPRALGGDDHQSNWEALVATKTRLEMWDDNLRGIPIPEGYAAIGSGAAFAITAMDCGKSASEAIKYAMRRDDGTGGRIVTIRLEPK